MLLEMLCFKSDCASLERLAIVLSKRTGPITLLRSNILSGSKTIAWFMPTLSTNLFLNHVEEFLKFVKTFQQLHFTYFKIL